MINSIQVSVIIPTYNRAELLMQTLKSLMLQDYPKNQFEVIVVDNNSEDDTAQRISAFISNNRDNLNLKYTQEKRQGDIYSRHSGAYNSEGNILLFTDDDATFDVNWISDVVQVFEKYPHVGAVGTRISIVWDKEPEDWVRNYENLLGKISFGEGYTISDTSMYINNGSLAIKKELYAEVGGNNPGQIKDFLIGDAEMGLCRKLHVRNIPIAFTDNTTMWHHQFVYKNGTFRDIMRRVANNGVAEAYTDYFINHIKNRKHLLIPILISIVQIPKAFLLVDKKKIINSRLKLNQLLHRYKFIKRFQTDRELICLMNTNDWQYDTNYVGSELIYNNKIDNGNN